MPAHGVGTASTSQAPPRRTAWTRSSTLRATAPTSTPPRRNSAKGSCTSSNSMPRCGGSCACSRAPPSRSRWSNTTSRPTSNRRSVRANLDPRYRARSYENGCSAGEPRNYRRPDLPWRRPSGRDPSSFLRSLWSTWSTWGCPASAARPLSSDRLHH
jgi:hypothetical protein